MALSATVLARHGMVDSRGLGKRAAPAMALSATVLARHGMVGQNRTWNVTAAASECASSCACTCTSTCACEPPVLPALRFAGWAGPAVCGTDFSSLQRHRILLIWLHAQRNKHRLMHPIAPLTQFHQRSKWNLLPPKDALRASSPSGSSAAASHSGFKAARS